MTEQQKQLEQARAALVEALKEKKRATCFGNSEDMYAAGYKVKALRARVAELSAHIPGEGEEVNALVDSVLSEAKRQGYLIKRFKVTSTGRACVLSYTGSGNAQPWVVHDFSVNSGGFFTGDYFASRENAFARFEERAGRAY